MIDFQEVNHFYVGIPNPLHLRCLGIVLKELPDFTIQGVPCLHRVAGQACGVGTLYCSTTSTLACSPCFAMGTWHPPISDINKQGGYFRTVP